MSERYSVLYIAYHFPPILGSSGVHRTLAFTRHLDEIGWKVRVLTTSVAAYKNWHADQFAFIPKGIEVIRAYARDTSRHFACSGRYLGLMALPDLWQSWILGGLVSGLRAIRRDRPDVIVSTYPIASAHIIGYLLHRLTGTPWVADLRDPMAQEDYPQDPKKKRIFEWIERKIVRHARRAIVTAPGARDFYLHKFPDSEPSFWVTIPNGYDAKMFEGIAPSPDAAVEDGRRRVLLHSGVIYPSERDPSDLFAALAELKAEGAIDADTLEVRLRASGNDAWIGAKADELGIDDLVSLVPPIPYREALQEMTQVDGLMLLQAENCNYQIPAKAYEYIRVQKPVLALTPPEGDTGQLFADLDIADVASLHDRESIKTSIRHWLDSIGNADERKTDAATVERYSRQNQARVFADLLSDAVADRPGVRSRHASGGP